MGAATTEALLFDMDGLLLDTERLALAAFIETADAAGLAGAEAFGLSLIGLSGKLCRPLIDDWVGAARAGQSFRANWDTAFAARLADGIPVRPGVAETLDALSDTGWRMVVVTSTRTPPARSHLDRAGLLPHFLDVIGSDRVATHKPDPAPYLMGAQVAGAHPARCHAFEDSDTGVAAAVAAGCIVSQVPDLRPETAPLPNLGQRVYKAFPEAVAGAGLL